MVGPGLGISRKIPGHRCSGCWSGDSTVRTTSPVGKDMTPEARERSFIPPRDPGQGTDFPRASSVKPKDLCVAPARPQ